MGKKPTGPGNEPFNAAILHLSDEGSIQAHLRLAKEATEKAKKSEDLAGANLRMAAEHYRTAAEHLALVCQNDQIRLPQKAVGIAIGKSGPWVNRLLKWRESGYIGNTPFGPQAKAKRDRARVQASERREQSATAEQHRLAGTLDRADAAKIEAAKARAEVERATHEAIRARAEAARERIRAENAYADTRVPGMNLGALRRRIDIGLRRRLVKTLGMLGSDQAGERASAALIAEKERAKLCMTWEELIVRVQPEDLDDHGFDDEERDDDLDDAGLDEEEGT
jgi:hypothetical protein